MASGPRYRVKFRRRREGKTDYHYRLALVKSGKPRLVVRTRSRSIIVQVIKFKPDGDRVLVTANSLELRKKGWKAGTANIPAAYLTGYLCGLRAKKAGEKSAVLDIGLEHKSRRIFAALQGVLDAGLEVPHGELKVPAEMLSGKHIANWSKSAPAPAFTSYKSRGLDASTLPEHLNKIKEQLGRGT